MKLIRKTALIAALTALSLVTGLWAFVYGPVWYVVKVPTHPAIDETRVGLIKELKAQGYHPGKNIDIDIESDGGNLITIQTLDDSTAKKTNKIHVAIGTTIAQNVMKTMAPDAYLVFSSVTNPVSAGLIKTPEMPEGRVTGVSNFIPAYPQLQFFKAVYPKLARIGFLYNPNEPNSKEILHEVLSSSAKLGLEVIHGVVTDSKEVETVADTLPQVDAFFSSNDNTVAAEWGDIAQIAETRKIPAFTSDTALIKYGALAAYGANQLEVGKATATMVIRLLKGEPVKAIPMVTVSVPNRVFNDARAADLGIKLSKEVDQKIDKHWPDGWLEDFRAWIKSLFN